MKWGLILAFVLSAFFAEPVSAWLPSVRAHGAGTVSGGSCDTAQVPAACSAGDEVSFSFAFSGTGTGAAVPVHGTFTAFDPVTGVRLDYSGPGTVIPQTHELQVTGACTVTTPGGGTRPDFCTLGAVDGTPNGAPDTIFISGATTNGTLSAGLTLTSGNITIK